MSVTTYNNNTTDPDVPSTGKVKFYFKDEEPTWRTEDGQVHTMSEPIFGKGVDMSAFDYYIMTTSGQTWDTYTSLQVPAGYEGEYIIFCFYHARMNSTGYDAWSRLALNGTELGLVAREEYKDSSNSEAMPRVLIKKATLEEGDYLDLDFATESTSATLTVKEACILLWRIA